MFNVVVILIYAWSEQIWRRNVTCKIKHREDWENILSDIGAKIANGVDRLYNCKD